jgi:hypothetical protein
MPSLPAVAHKTESITPLNPVVTDVSDGGVLFAQDLGQTLQYEIVLEHPLISAAEYLSLKTFYAANRTTTVTTPTLADGATYDGIMIGEPQLIEQDGVFNTVRTIIHGSRN